MPGIPKKVVGQGGVSAEGGLNGERGWLHSGCCCHEQGSLGYNSCVQLGPGDVQFKNRMHTRHKHREKSPLKRFRDEQSPHS